MGIDYHIELPDMYIGTLFWIVLCATINSFRDYRDIYEIVTLIISVMSCVVTPAKILQLIGTAKVKNLPNSIEILII